MIVILTPRARRALERKGVLCGRQKGGGGSRYSVPHTLPAAIEAGRWPNLVLGDDGYQRAIRHVRDPAPPPPAPKPEFRTDGDTAPSPEVPPCEP